MLKQCLRLGVIILILSGGAYASNVEELGQISGRSIEGVSQDGQWVATTSGGSLTTPLVIQVRNAATNKVEHSLRPPHHLYAIRGAEFSPDKKLLIANAQGSVYAFNIKNQELVWEFNPIPSSDGEIRTVLLSRDGQNIFVLHRKILEQQQELVLSKLEINDGAIIYTSSKFPGGGESLWIPTGKLQDDQASHILLWSTSENVDSQRQARVIYTIDGRNGKFLQKFLPNDKQFISTIHGFDAYLSHEGTVHSRLNLQTMQAHQVCGAPGFLMNISPDRRFVFWQSLNESSLHVLDQENCQEVATMNFDFHPSNVWHFNVRDGVWVNDTTFALVTRGLASIPFELFVWTLKDGKWERIHHQRLSSNGGVGFYKMITANNRLFISSPFMPNLAWDI